MLGPRLNSQRGSAANSVSPCTLMTLRARMAPGPPSFWGPMSERRRADSCRGRASPRSLSLARLVPVEGTSARQCRCPSACPFDRSLPAQVSPDDQLSRRLGRKLELVAGSEIRGRRPAPWKGRRPYCWPISRCAGSTSGRYSWDLCSSASTSRLVGEALAALAKMGGPRVGPVADNNNQCGRCLPLLKANARRALAVSDSVASFGMLS